MILLRCKACPNEKLVKRMPYDYPEAVVIEVHCDNHNVEGSEPMYYDIDGNHITRDPEQPAQRT
jgi:hypothetical protein